MPSLTMILVRTLQKRIMYQTSFTVSVEFELNNWSKNGNVNLKTKVILAHMRDAGVTVPCDVTLDKV